MKKCNLAINFANFMNFWITVFHISESIQLILMKFGTHIALISSVKINISFFGKKSIWPQFVCIQTILMKFGTNIIGLINSLKVNISTILKGCFYKFHYDLHFYSLLYIISNCHFQVQSKCLDFLWKFLKHIL